MRTEKEIKDMQIVIQCLFTSLDEKEENTAKEDDDMGTLLDYLDVFNWLNEEPTMLEDILLDFTERYAPEAFEAGEE
jgi:hypothetical protein